MSRNIWRNMRLSAAFYVGEYWLIYGWDSLSQVGTAIEKPLHVLWIC